MAVNKVIYGDTTLIDLTSDTVAADKILEGYTAHDKSGTFITGTYSSKNATLTVVYSKDFYGATITATNGSKTLTAVATSSGSVEFKLPEDGTWTVSATLEGQTYSESVLVDTSYSTELSALPNGSTATPVNVIQTWLKCAGITDKTTYTTLADVLADTDTFIALCADSNASDYMARSTTWASGVTADATAMQIVGKYDYCANALLSDSTWASAICNSTYWNSILEPLVPTMTSNTTPSGECFGSGNNGSQFDYYCSMNGQTMTTSSFTNKSWLASANTPNSYVGYKFTQNVRVYKTVFKCFTNYGSQTDLSVTVQIGDNKVDWKTIGSDTVTVKLNNITEYAILTPNATTGDSVRIYDAEGVNWYVKSGLAFIVGGLQFYGRVDHGYTGTVIHSAVEDTTYYVSGGSNVPFCTIASGDTETVLASTIESLKNQTITLYSSVAKDPTNLSNDFTMPVRITPNITEIYLMPLGELYWWGHKGATLDIASTASGWTYSGTFLSPSYQKNYADCYSYGNWNIICFTTKNAVHSASKVCAIGQGIRKSPSDHYFDLQGRTSKTFNNGASGLVNGTTTLDVTTMAKIENDVSGGSDFYPVANTAGNQCYVYAVWFEV